MAQELSPLMKCAGRSVTMLDKSVLDYQLTEVFGQYGLESREFDLLNQLFTKGEASVPSGQFPGLLVKGILVALSLPGTAIVFYSQDSEIEKISGRLGEIGVDSLGIIGEATPAGAVERAFCKAESGRLNLLLIHSSMSVDDTVVQGYQNLCSSRGISACFLAPELFHRVEVQNWSSVFDALSSSFPEGLFVPLMDLGGARIQGGITGSFDLSDAEKSAIFSPLESEEEDEEEFLRTVIRTSPFHSAPSGPPVELKPIQMPSGDGRNTGGQASEPEDSGEISGDTLSGFQTMDSILGRARDDHDEDLFSEARSQVSVSPPQNRGDELEGGVTSRLDNLFNTWVGEVRSDDLPSGRGNTLMEYPQSLSEEGEIEDDEDELEVLLVEADDEVDETDDVAELDELIAVLDTDEGDESSASGEDLVKAIGDTFPTYGSSNDTLTDDDFSDEAPEEGSVTRVMLASEVPSAPLS
jgi:hypothetical protein